MRKDSVVGVIMGSRSHWETLRHAAETLEALGVPFEARVVSAHRTPDLLIEYAERATARGLEVIIAGGGGAAHLPGMVAAKTLLPVLGVPVPSSALSGRRRARRAPRHRAFGTPNRRRPPRRPEALRSGDHLPIRRHLRRVHPWPKTSTRSATSRLWARFPSGCGLTSSAPSA